ncbi:MAG TPA: GntR family transcriptional regulator [Pseudolabrys sp.]
MRGFATGNAMKRSDEVLRLVYQWIENGTLAAGTKAPSVRHMSRITGYSMSTVHNAYGILESAGVFVAHPRYGFFVDSMAPKARQEQNRENEEVSASAYKISINELTLRLFASWGNSEIQQFGAIYASDDLFPIAELNRHFRRIPGTATVPKVADATQPSISKVRSV